MFISFYLPVYLFPSYCILSDLTYLVLSSLILYIAWLILLTFFGLIQPYRATYLWVRMHGMLRNVNVNATYCKCKCKHECEWKCKYDAMYVYHVYETLWNSDCVLLHAHILDVQVCIHTGRQPNPVLRCWHSINLTLRALKGLRRAQWANMSRAQGASYVT